MTKSRPRVFFDASVLFCAFCSKTGGSAKTLRYVKSGKIKGFISQTVIEETEVNLKESYDRQLEISAIIANSGFVVLEKIETKYIAFYVGKIHKKDAHIIAGAMLTQCTHILTLDKKHIDNDIIKKRFPKIIILSPKELIKFIEG